MNRINSFTGNIPFKPAVNLLSSQQQSKSKTKDNNRRLEDGHGHRRSMSIDDSPPRQRQDGFLGGNTSTTTDEQLHLHHHHHHPRSIPTITVSRSPSPSLRRIRSASQSEDEDYEDLALSNNDAALSRPLVGHGTSTRRGQRAGLWRKGGLGRFLFRTATGHQVYIGMLVFWLMGCQFGLLLMDRFLLWTGTYKFPYPLTLTMLQLLLTHLLLLAFASLTRLARGPLHNLGLGALVAPAEPLSKTQAPQGYRRPQTSRTLSSRLARRLNPGTGGIAGGGLIDLDRKTVKQVLPVALIFLARVVLSNISYAYAVLPVYQLSRIAIVPLSLICTALINNESHSIPTLSSTLTATLNLLIASIQHGVLRSPWQAILAGASSSLFTALYPIQLLRTYQTLLSDLTPQGSTLLTDLTPSSDSDTPQAPLTPSTVLPTTRAVYKTLHAASLLSLLALTPIWLLIPELPLLRRNCYFLDVPWFWFLIFCSGLGAFTVFTATLLLVKATSPLSTTFISVPRSAWQLAVLSKGNMPVRCWVGVALCWAGSAWFLGVRRREGRKRVGGLERGC
ncbi:hypothetical protein MBLNU230_g8243t1 [Neophaeotheca triangularis]